MMADVASPGGGGNRFKVKRVDTTNQGGETDDFEVTYNFIVIFYMGIIKLIFKNLERTEFRVN